jgi:hypothetical protein
MIESGMSFQPAFSTSFLALLARSGFFQRQGHKGRQDARKTGTEEDMG